jgi:outer membrane lipoprotein carrier protein
MRSMKKMFAAAVAALALAAHASGLDALDAFIKSAKSGRASFTQVVTSPSREGQPGKTRTSTGTFEFARPSRFRFDYQKPFQEEIVADGKTLWFYDADLKQVTSRNQDAVLGSTPAALIASAGSTAALLRDFNLEGAPEKDGLQWAVATPKNKDGQLTQMRIGFRGNELAQLEILDGFGQRSVIKFDKMEMNAAIPAERFNFKPPQGAAVVKQ